MPGGRRGRTGGVWWRGGEEGGGRGEVGRAGAQLHT